MNKLLALLIFHFLLFTFHFATAQNVGIGTNIPNPSAQLDVSSTNKGFLPPRMTFDERNAIQNPVAGLTVYCTNCGNGEMQFYNGTNWMNMTVGVGSVPFVLPTLSTANPFFFTDFFVVTSGGDITSDGGTPITARGVVWSTSTNPTIDLSTKTSNGTGSGVFTSFTTTLSANTTYYLRAYATNIVGTSYGNEVSFTTPDPILLPAVSTTSPSFIADSYAVCGGNITSDGGSASTERGVVWSTSPNPTIDLATKTINGTGTGSFTSIITGLTANTTYYVRAYATNIAGTSYGNGVSFTTANPAPPNTVSDIAGNTYPTVKIGTQEWMVENLRTTKYSDGSNIPVVSDNTEWKMNLNNGLPLQQPMMCWYNNDQATYTTNKFGVLYNWYAINPATNGNKNVCPAGWHVPTDIEWSTLINFLDPNAGGGINDNTAGGNMKSTGTLYWTSPNTGANNLSGFSGLPGGYRNGLGSFDKVGDNGYWWSSTDIFTSDAWNRSLSHFFGNVNSSYLGKTYGLSVRCIKD